MRNLCLLRLGWLVLLGGMGRVAAAQDAPVYPPPAPLDTAGLAHSPDAKTFANSQVVGMGPSKGLIVKYERLPDFNIRSTAKAAGLSDYNSQVRNNKTLLIKGYVPLLNHPHLKLVLGVNYERQEYNFAEKPAYELYENIEGKSLKTLGAQLAIIRPIDGVHYFILRTKSELNGDYTSDELSIRDYLKTTAEFIYGWKRSPTFAWGLGVQVGYVLGRQSIYPVLVYNRTFNSRYGIEALFPARVLLRRNLSPRSLLFAGYEVVSSNYNIKLSRVHLATADNPDLRTLELSQIDVKFRLRFEHELLSFLWTGIEAGYKYNYSFNAYDHTASRTRAAVIDSQLAAAPFASLDLFIVPPRKLLQRAESRRK